MFEPIPHGLSSGNQGVTAESSALSPAISCNRLVIGR